MIQPSPPFAFWMGGEHWNDPISACTVVFGGTAVDDGNWPGYAESGGVEPDDDSQSVECLPPTLQFTAEPDKPAAHRSYPLRQCAATGPWGAPHAMVLVDGRWYLRACAPDPRSMKRYPPHGPNQ